MKHDTPAELLVIQYAQNRTQFREATKKVDALTDYRREDKGVDISAIREEYLAEDSQWKGWMHAIDVVRGIRDPEDDEPITFNQIELAKLLDRKAELRGEAGKIKRAFFALGQKLLKHGGQK